VAVGDLGQKGGDVGGRDHLQEGVGGVVPEAPHFAGGVVEGQARIRAEAADHGLVKAFLPRQAKMLPVPKMNQAHDAPEVVDPVGVIERHAPAVRLGRKTPQEQDARSLREERLEWVALRVHATG